MKKQLALIPSILFPLFVLSSCGGSSDDNDRSIDSTGSQVEDIASSNDESVELDSEPVTGLVRFLTENFDSVSSLEIIGNFVLTDEQDVQGAIARLNQADACLLERLDGSTIVSTGGFVDIPFGFTPPRAFAGDEIAINADGSLFQNLGVNFVRGSLYTLNPPDANPIAGPLPSNVTVTIPGGTMVQSFTNEPVPDVEGVVVLNPDFSVLDRNTGFQWAAPTISVENSRMTVEVVLDTPVDNESAFSLRCSLVDDGLFLFPEELAPIIDQVGVDNIDFTRTNWRTVQNGSTTLHLLNEERLSPLCCSI